MHVHTHTHIHSVLKFLFIWQMATIIEKYGAKMHHLNTFCNQPRTIFVFFCIQT